MHTAGTTLIAVILIGLGLALPRQGSAQDAPAGATARCGDGTYSTSTARQGTCSRHRGVAEWLVPAGATAPCTDGTYSTSTARRGPCSHHRGVVEWLERSE